MDPHRRKQRAHFIIVAFPVQSHLNPALNLAHRLVSTTDALVTFSTAASAHRRLFSDADHDDETLRITYVPYPDGGTTRNKQSDANINTDSELATGFSHIISGLAAGGRRVTCVIYTLILSWVPSVAHEHGIPSVQYWIQPATTLATYYHYFHGYADVIAAHINDPMFPVKLPGLPPLQIRDVPSFLTCATLDGVSSMIHSKFKESFKQLDMDQAEPKQKILVNTFEELEPEALVAVEKLDLIAIGPILPSLEKAADGKTSEFDLIKSDAERYMDWLNKQAKKSVVYVSFGSISVLKKNQMDGILKGLKSSGRPYLWVVRKDNRLEGFDVEEDGEKEMVVEWCSQVRVLNHPSVGCFVTHCGWNSTMESLVCGVPTVGVPQWADQGTNVMLMEKVWGNGVRVEINKQGVLEGEELKRCLDLVMEDGGRGEKIRRNAELWREKAREAVTDGGSSDHNLKMFCQRDCCMLSKFSLNDSSKLLKLFLFNFIIFFHKKL